jgi:hypothetical protein
MRSCGSHNVLKLQAPPTLLGTHRITDGADRLVRWQRVGIATDSVTRFGAAHSDAIVAKHITLEVCFFSQFLCNNGPKEAMKRLRLIHPAVVLAFAALASAQSTDISTIRLTYAKAQYMNQVGLLENGGSPAAAVSFTLADFRSGNFANNSQPISSIGTGPDGRKLLTLILGGWTDSWENKVVGSERSLMATWRPAPPRPASEGHYGWDAPISLMSVDNPWADHFISYQVTVSYAGKKETYRAAFIFGGGKSAPLDMITTNMPSVAITPLTQVYPAILLRSWRDKAGVIDWLNSNQVSGQTCQSGEVCCDLAAMKCGILPEDLQKELQQKPISLTAPEH